MPDSEKAKVDKFKRRTLLFTGYICMFMILGYFVLDIAFRNYYKINPISRVVEELSKTEKECR